MMFFEFISHGKILAYKELTLFTHLLHLIYFYSFIGILRKKSIRYFDKMTPTYSITIIKNSLARVKVAIYFQNYPFKARIVYELSFVSIAFSID
ncbi:MAG: hypothetical protein ACE5GU_15405 [Candidatus Scalinduaceae bacterium]